MKAHIEYDDFGEYIEILEEAGDKPGCPGGRGRVQEGRLSGRGRGAQVISFARRAARGLARTLGAVMIMFATTSFALPV